MTETKKTPEQYAAEIAKNWTKDVATILATGASCADAHDQLDKDERQILMQKLKGSMTKGNFSKLVRIGRESNRLQKIRDKLPPSYTTIYLIARLNDDELEKAVSDGLINPSVGRDEVATLAGARTPPPSNLLGALYASKKCSDETRHAVLADVRQLALKYQDEIRVRPDDLSAPAKHAAAAE